MSYICDGCGTTEKLFSRIRGIHLCRLCRIKENLKPLIDFCCRCMRITPHDLWDYRRRIKGRLYNQCKVCRLKTEVKELPTREDLIGHRKVDLQGI